MLRQTLWLERSWKFDFPVGHLPMIIERLRGTPARLEERLLRVPRAVLTRKRGDAWSAQEHAGHLLITEELFIGRLDDFENRVAVLRAADMSNLATHQADLNAAEIGDLLARFRERRMEFVRRLNGYTGEEASRAILHPRLKTPIRPVDNAFFAAEHDDHHLALISAALDL